MYKSINYLNFKCVIFICQIFA